MFKQFRFIPLVALALTFAACWNNKKSNSLDSADSATSNKTGNGQAIHLVKTEEQLDSLLKKSTSLLIVKCETTWCSACKDMEPFFIAAAEQLPDYTFARVDVDVVPTIAKNYDLVGVPTILFMKDGKEISNSRMVGALVENTKDFVTKIQEVAGTSSDQSISKQNSLVATLDTEKNTPATPATPATT